MADEEEEEKEGETETIEDLFKGEQGAEPEEGESDGEAAGDDAEAAEEAAESAEESGDDEDDEDEEESEDGDDGGDEDDEDEEESEDGDDGGDEDDEDKGGSEDGDVEPEDDESGDDGEADDGDGSADDDPPMEDEPAPATEGGPATANGGAASAGTTSGGIDETLLDAGDRADPPQPAGGSERLTTGIEALDHHLGGGIPPGRIVSFVATADTQSELLVKQLASQHDCLYLSTLRPKWEVQEEVTDYVQKQGESSSDQHVQIEQLPADSRIDAARRHVEALDRQSVVVIDSANELETSEKDRYAYFIDELKRALWDTGSVGLCYCIEEEQPPDGRDVTLRRADLVWRLRQSEDVGGIRHELLVSKFRGGRALIEPLSLWLTDEVVMHEGSGGS